MPVLYGNPNAKQILIVEKFWIFDRLKDEIDPRKKLLVYASKPGELGKLGFLEGKRAKFIGDLDSRGLGFLLAIRRLGINARFAGPRPSDAKKNPGLTIKINPSEMKQLKALANFRDREIRRLAEFLVKTGRKMEIEAMKWARK